MPDELKIEIETPAAENAGEPTTVASAVDDAVKILAVADAIKGDGEEVLREIRSELAKVNGRLDSLFAFVEDARNAVLDAIATSVNITAELVDDAAEQARHEAETVEEESHAIETEVIPATPAVAAPEVSTRKRRWI